MPANPDPGLSYRQEYFEGEAEDKAAVITIGEERVQVPLGYFEKGRPDDARPGADGAEGPGTEVLRPGHRPSVERAHGWRRQPCRTDQLLPQRLASVGHV